jgi:hypothetical protein
MADASDRAETKYHLLIDVKNRDQQHQRIASGRHRVSSAAL